MPSNIKLLKFALPIATATTAAIATIYLVAASRKDQEKKTDEDSLLDNLELVTEKFEEEIKVEQGDESEKTQDSEGESDAEKTQKVKDLLKKELSAEHKQRLVNELLKDPKKLAEKISKENDVQVSAEELEKIMSKDAEIKEQLEKIKGQASESASGTEDKGPKGEAGSQNPAVSKEIEQHSSSSEERMEAPSQEGPSSMPNNSLNETSPEIAEKDLLSQETQGKTKELEKSQKDAEALEEAKVAPPETEQQLDNEKNALTEDSRNDSVQDSDDGPSGPDHEEGEFQESTTSGTSVEDLSSPKLESKGAGSPKEMEGVSDDSSDGLTDANGEDGVLDDADEKTELDREKQLAELTGWKGKIEDVLSRFSGRFNLR